MNARRRRQLVRDLEYEIRSRSVCEVCGARGSAAFGPSRATRDVVRAWLGALGYWSRVMADRL